MKKAATLKVSAKLRQLTKLAVVRENATRWSSTYEMIDRYFKIQMQLSALVELLELLPTPLEVDTLSRGFRCLENFQAITKILQRDRIPFTEVRGIFITSVLPLIWLSTLISKRGYCGLGKEPR